MRLDVFDHVDHGARIDSTPATNESMGTNAKILIIFIEEDDDFFFGLKIRGDEDGNVGLCLRGAKWKSDLLKTKANQAFRDDIANGFYWRVND